MVAPSSAELLAIHWYVAVFEELPAIAQKEGLVVAEGFEQDEPPEASELDYMLLFRTAAASEADACVHVRSAMTDQEIVPIRVERLNTKGLAIARAERKAIRQLLAGDVSANACFVGFKKGCANAQRTALSVIQQSIVRPAWKFWG